jgi:hypothetical protein
MQAFKSFLGSQSCWAAEPPYGCAIHLQLFPRSCWDLESVLVSIGTLMTIWLDRCNDFLRRLPQDTSLPSELSLEQPTLEPCSSRLGLTDIILISIWISFCANGPPTHHLPANNVWYVCMFTDDVFRCNNLLKFGLTATSDCGINKRSAEIPLSPGLWCVFNNVLNSKGSQCARGHDS